MPQNAEEKMWSRLVWTVVGIVVGVAAIPAAIVYWLLK